MGFSFPQRFGFVKQCLKIHRELMTSLLGELGHIGSGN